MSEERDGNPVLPAPRPGPLRRIQALRRASRIRRLTATGLPAMLALSGAVPFVVFGATSGRAAAPSYELCTGWHHCSSRGFGSHGYGAHDGAMYWRMYPGDNCTNYVAYVESTHFHAPTPRYLLGDGGQWAGNAAAHGVVVNHTPSVGAVAEWADGTAGIGPLGHVAVVERVGPHDRYIDISQQNMSSDANGFDWTRIRAGFPSYEWQEWPSYFIHFKIRVRAVSQPNVGYYRQRSHSVSLRHVRSAKAADTFRLGFSGADPLLGDWAGRGREGVGYYSPRYGVFHLRDKLSAGSATYRFRFGPPGMIPLVGDWNGKGKDGVGYYDPRTGIFRLRNKLSPGPLYRSFRFGPAHMIALAGVWAGGRKDGVGYYDPKIGTYHLRTRLSNGPASFSFRFGPPGMVPVAGA